MKDLASEFVSMSENWKGNRPPSVERLPTFIPITQVSSIRFQDQFVVGKSQESLEPVGLSLATDGPLFLITSMTSGLGKTSALYLWLSQLTKLYSPESLKLVIIDYHTRTLRYFTSLPHVATFQHNGNARAHVTRKEDLKAVVEWLNAEVSDRREQLAKMYSDSPENFDDVQTVKSLGYILIVIDDYEAFNNSRPSEMQTFLSSIVDGEEVGVRLLLAEDYALLGTDELIRRVKKYGCGMLMGGSEGLMAFNVAQPPYNQKTSNLPPGRGYLIKRGQAEFIQACTFWEQDQERILALKRLLKID